MDIITIVDIFVSRVTYSQGKKLDITFQLAHPRFNKSKIYLWIKENYSHIWNLHLLRKPFPNTAQWLAKIYIYIKYRRKKRENNYLNFRF